MSDTSIMDSLLRDNTLPARRVATEPLAAPAPTDHLIHHTKIVDHAESHSSGKQAFGTKTETTRSLFSSPGTARLDAHASGPSAIVIGFDANAADVMRNLFKVQKSLDVAVRQVYKAGRPSWQLTITPKDGKQSVCCFIFGNPSGSGCFASFCGCIPSFEDPKDTKVAWVRGGSHLPVVWAVCDALCSLSMRCSVVPRTPFEQRLQSLEASTSSILDAIWA